MSFCAWGFKPLAEPRKAPLAKTRLATHDQPMTEKTASTKATKAPETLLAELRERYPKAFPSDPEAVMPLAIRIHQALAAAGYSRKAVEKALGVYVATPAYLAAVAACKPRVNLDGVPAGKVSEVQRVLAEAKLQNPAATMAELATVVLAGRIDQPEPQQKKKMAQIELSAFQAKIAFTIDPETFRAALEVDSVGAKTVPAAITVDGRKYTADLNPKSFRKAQAAFREAANPVVAISGNLKGTKVESAGIQVFDKGAKAAE